MNKQEIRRITSCVHIDLRFFILSIKNVENAENIIPVAKRIQGYLFSLEINESQLITDYICVVRNVLKQSISVHKSLFQNEVVIDTESLKKAILDYNSLICSMKNEYDSQPLKTFNNNITYYERNADVVGVKTSSDRASRHKNNKENLDPEEKRYFMSPVASSYHLDASSTKLNSSLKNKLSESEKKLALVELLLENAEKRVKEAEERALRSEQLILNMENEINLQSFLVKILSGNLNDKNYKEVFKQLQIDEKIEKMQSLIKEERKILKERKGKSNRPRKSTGLKKPILLPSIQSIPNLNSKNSVYLEETDEEKALQQLITQLLM